MPWKLEAASWAAKAPSFYAMGMQRWLISPQVLFLVMPGGGETPGAVPCACAVEKLDVTALRPRSTNAPCAKNDVARCALRGSVSLRVGA